MNGMWKMLAGAICVLALFWALLLCQGGQGQTPEASGLPERGASAQRSLRLLGERGYDLPTCPPAGETSALIPLRGSQDTLRLMMPQAEAFSHVSLRLPDGVTVYAAAGGYVMVEIPVPGQEHPQRIVITVPQPGDLTGISRLPEKREAL